MSIDTLYTLNDKYYRQRVHRSIRQTESTISSTGGKYGYISIKSIIKESFISSNKR